MSSFTAGGSFLLKTLSYEVRDSSAHWSVLPHVDVKLGLESGPVPNWIIGVK